MDITNSLCFHAYFTIIYAVFIVFHYSNKGQKKSNLNLASIVELLINKNSSLSKFIIKLTMSSTEHGFGVKQGTTSL